MKDYFGRLKLTFGITISIVLLVILSPIILLSIPFSFFRNKELDKEYQIFLNKNNGKKFFCYTSRKNSKEIIETHIIPNLSEDINIILLDGKKPKSDFPEKYVSRMLYRLENIGFPNIMQILDGKVIDISLKKDFYNELNTEKKTSNFTEVVKLGFLVIDGK
ncbi:MAG: hypothetical protein AB9846_13800 [Tenuifilaceae bacterium]